MRSQDLHMAAAMDMKRRHVLVTGAIDQNDQNLLMRIHLPEPGTWTFMKAEVNLTDRSWFAWKITLGGGCRLPEREEDQLVQCRQFKRTRYLPDQGVLLFTDGEVRPGEPILKVFNVDILKQGDKSIGAAVMSHVRLIGVSDLALVDAAVADTFGEDLPKIEIEVPVRIIE